MLRRSVVGALALAVPALWTGGLVQAQTDTRLTTCPSEAEVRASIEKWSVNYNVGVFRTKAVDGFRFGPMAFGDISKVLVSVGEEPRDTCPVRLAYKFVITSADGSRADRNWAETVHYFYRNPFKEWVYRTAGS